MFLQNICRHQVSKAYEWGSYKWKWAGRGEIHYTSTTVDSLGVIEYTGITHEFHV